MAEEKKPSYRGSEDFPSHSGSEKRSYRKDSADDVVEVMFNSSLGVPPGKVVTESFKEPKHPKNK
ncbi:hypothetical protein IFU33_07875 [Pantoea agglomerans]|uniref:hypothetical protein n=1 Tax=Enterobacter agglomerans TaxID=549 RepID=UPI0017820CDC|nr:hypothetical protein [Pantoea agglomerans]WVJ47898.1 hypothetical protein IFU33_07875 [Pantoea agglomerans]